MTRRRSSRAPTLMSLMTSLPRWRVLFTLGGAAFFTALHVWQKREGWHGSGSAYNPIPFTDCLLSRRASITFLLAAGLFSWLSRRKNHSED